MNRREFIGGAAAFAAIGMKTATAGDSAELAAAKKWFKEAQFGMMVHWGLYTLPGGEWKGRSGRHPYGEWIMHGERIPNAEYGRLAKAFNPVLFDPNDWIARARDYMLNVGPDPLGRFPPAAVDILSSLGGNVH